MNKRDEDIPTRDLRRPTQERARKTLERVRSMFVDDTGVVSPEDAAATHRERMASARGPSRERRPSSIVARADMMMVLADRLRSIPALDVLDDDGWRALQQVIGESYDAGERRAETKAQSLYRRISELEAERADAEDRAIRSETARRTAESMPPVSSSVADTITRQADGLAQRDRRIAWLESELTARGVRIPEPGSSDS